jgi:hypothetical protein
MHQRQILSSKEKEHLLVVPDDDVHMYFLGSVTLRKCQVTCFF